jgi:hypothetical protein
MSKENSFSAKLSILYYADHIQDNQPCLVGGSVHYAKRITDVAVMAFFLVLTALEKSRQSWICATASS